MAKLDKSYNVDEMPKSERQQGDFQPLPEGWYRARITQAPIKDTKNGGQRIAPRFDIVGPTHAGRVVFDSLNIKNSNPETERIAWEQFGELCRACGLGRISDTDELVGKVLDIRLKVKAANGDYPAGNEVKGYRSVNGSDLPAPNAAGAPAASGGSKAPPWKR